MLIKSTQRGQKYRIFDLLFTDSIMVHLAVDTAFPTVLVSAPRPVRWLAFVVLLLGIADFFGLFRRLLNPQKAIASERL